MSFADRRRKNGIAGNDAVELGHSAAVADAQAVEENALAPRIRIRGLLDLENRVCIAAPHRPNRILRFEYRDHDQADSRGWSRRHSARRASPDSVNRPSSPPWTKAAPASSRNTSACRIPCASQSSTATPAS